MHSNALNVDWLAMRCNHSLARRTCPCSEPLLDGPAPRSDIRDTHSLPASARGIVRGKGGVEQLVKQLSTEDGASIILNSVVDEAATESLSILIELV